MLDELVKDHLGRIQMELDKYRKFPLQTDDNKLEMHLELSNARYRKAYESIKALKQYTESPSRSIQTTNELDRKNDMESFMKIMMIQQFQQQNLLYQSALLNTLTKAGKRNRSLNSFHGLQNNENASKLRIFGYIHLFAVIIKQSMIQLPFRLSSRESFALMLRYSVNNLADSLKNLPFRLSSRQSFTLMLRYSVDYLADNLKDINKDLGRKLNSMNMNTAYQFYLLLNNNLDNKQQKTLKIELQDILDNILIELTEKLSEKPLFAMNKNSTIYMMLKKDQVYPKNYFITIEKLFLGFELGLSTTVMTSNKVSINNKLLGSICTYIYRKIMVDIISERTRTTDLAKCKRWLQDYGRGILTL
ncbi:uncharacterized protein DC041_0000356 [Schistosoma bovis]|uniref:Uncharacterized protein n=1 Tax=Schistosoma bovis TaxID=6184 RepID=A0A430Q787_SCHBO|nr:uncharacterized protein DC041_0000356 [Schistosoma bovis]